MNFQGTKIILFNLWEDDEGQLELDFESDPYVGVIYFCYYITLFGQI